MDDLPSLHNISFGLNLTSILDYLPSKFLSRFMYKFKQSAASPTELDLASLPPPTISDLLATTTDWDAVLPEITKAPAAGGKTKLSSSSEERSLLLGPLGFFTSGYMLGLFLMAFILHRLHHTVIPSRLARRGFLRRGPRYSGRAIVFIRVYHSIFPIDLSKTPTRFALQFPTLYCLLRMCLLWGLIILQTSGAYPETLPSWMPSPLVTAIQKLGEWAANKPMDDVCWISFCSLSMAYFVESFVRKLDELANGTVEEVHLGRQMSPYNLVAHSFVLYLFSLSASHVNKPDGLPPRPDTHALITMGIPLLQSTLFHILCVHKKYSNHRLIPTALTSFLGLVHFHSTVILRGYPAVFLPLITERTKTPADNNVFSGTGFRSSYPLMNYFSCVIETALLAVILLTVFLNTVVQLLVNGRVDRVFTSLGIAASGIITDNPDSDSAQFSWSNLPFEEEWGVVLMRIGTASLEATGLKGWGNEVAPISAPIRAPRQTVRRRGRNPPPPPPPEPLITYGSVRMGRSGVGRVLPGSRVTDPQPNANATHRSNAASGRQVSRPAIQLRGWNNEVRTVDTNGGATTRRGAETRRWIWLRELVRFAKSASGVLVGLMRFIWACAVSWRSPKGFDATGEEVDRRLRRRQRLGRTGSSEAVDSTAADESRKERELYERFLRGEDISDDEEDAVVDDDFNYELEDEEGTESPSESGDVDEEASRSTPIDRAISILGEEFDQRERQEEAISLFTDLVRSQGVDEGSRLVWGHLARTTGRESSPAPPLTRRRWGEMGRRWGLGFVDDVEEDTWEVVGASSLGMDTGDGSVNGSDVDWTDRTMCIICTSRPRDIVSWPCR
ncbi:hypothetical protein NP233_g2208 [Leucocoprinus birnbaumii]|uniref:Uncharacterized protein n=1 Tax=Leucocoprinus birnbaumii TaxID=56174 RepID=A0AAD5VYP0_9AGAR|nr:hypothetical protein NP233_g2208 [Leucocoprinus birnbaumii]